MCDASNYEALKKAAVGDAILFTRCRWRLLPRKWRHTSHVSGVSNCRRQ